MLAVVVIGLVATGCARKAEEKVAEAGQDLKDAWRAERDAAVTTLKKSVEASAQEAERLREGIAGLEREAKRDAAAVARRTLDGLEATRAAAAREIAALERAEEHAWKAAHETAVAAARKIEQAGARAARFAAATKDEFVAEARAAVQEGERELAWARDRLAAAGEATRAEAQALVNDLDAKQRKAAAELRRVENASEGAWAEMRHGFVAAYHDLADASARARERLAAGV
jgi:SWI/SNF-related matrix-associated actin-dependent regulator 1 of chromatin subfamily A